MSDTHSTAISSASSEERNAALASSLAHMAIVNEHNQLLVRKEDFSLEAIKQCKVHCLDELSKIYMVADLILELGEKLGQAIIFINRRHDAAMLHEELVSCGYRATTLLHKALEQVDIDTIVKKFGDGIIKVLISTDGLLPSFDESEINLVINYDLPINHSDQLEPDYEVYLDRIGRLGRFGRKGAVFNLLSQDLDDMIMSKIEYHLQHTVVEVPLPPSDDFMVF